MVALDIWELALLPSLLNNAGTWTEMSKDTESDLEELQLFFVRLILRVPQSTLKVTLRSETGLQSMKHRVEKQKVMLVHHLKNLDARTLARQVYDQQKENSWPGLVLECQNICKRLGLEDVNNTECTQREYKKMLDAACRREDEIKMRKEMEGKTKAKDILTESLSLKDYMKGKSLCQIREWFRIRTNMNGMKANFKHDQRRGEENFLCVACGLEDEINSHVMVCREYEDLRRDRDLGSSDDLVK